MIVTLGLVSSVISAIIAAIILVEVMCALPVARKTKIDLTVISCFSIGLGAVLTPLGEPLSTIAISKLSGPPYYATFGFLFEMLGIYVIPGVFAFGLIGVLYLRRLDVADQAGECEVYSETHQRCCAEGGKGIRVHHGARIPR